ncbi:MAG TPA: globin domain-containing protein [Streptosporangiaceae bacterium]|nr:globin domain-containing protein [Streptosporangiaceae bacterium]
MSTTPPAANEFHESRARFSPQTDELNHGVSLRTPTDHRTIKESLALIEPVAKEFITSFHGRLFAENPKLRGMFPASMSDHGDRLFAAITRIVWSLDSQYALDSYAADLGRDHRKFGVIPAHYTAICAAFMATLRAFLADGWTAEVQGAWQDAFDRVSNVMIRAADDDACQAPPWWLGDVVAHDKRGPDIAVLTVRPTQPLPYRSGQYVSVQCARWPRVWRTYSIANAPREDGIIQFHVRAIPGGWVSGSLVHYTRPGDTLLLSRADGTMVPETGSARHVLCVAGGTGLAPIKAIIEQLLHSITPGAQRRIHLFFGTRKESDLYDLTALRRMASCHPSLQVIPVVSDDAQFDGIRGLLPDVVARQRTWPDHDVYISGPAGLVRETTQVLTTIGIPITRIYSDPLGTDA